MRWGGPAGLEERSRVTVGHPKAIPLEVVKKLIAAKLCHQKWGPKKVIAWLRGRHPEEQWPAMKPSPL